jgi:hypothetical protein
MNDHTILTAEEFIQENSITGTWTKDELVEFAKTYSKLNEPIELARVKRLLEESLEKNSHLDAELQLLKFETIKKQQ